MEGDNVSNQFSGVGRSARRLSSAIDAVVAVFASVLLVSIVVDVFAGVVFRYVIGRALPWSEEYARFAMVWMGLLGAGMALIRNEHVAIEYFVSHMPPSLRLLSMIVSRILIALFLFYATTYGSRMVLNAGTQVSPGLGISMAWPLSSIPVSSLIMLVQLILHTVDEFSSGRTGLMGERPAES